MLLFWTPYYNHRIFKNKYFRFHKNIKPDVPSVFNIDIIWRYFTAKCRERIFVARK